MRTAKSITSGLRLASSIITLDTPKTRSKLSEGLVRAVRAVPQTTTLAAITSLSM